MFAYCGNNPVNAVDYTGNQMCVCSDYDWDCYYGGGGGGGGIVSFWLLGVIIDFFTSSQDPVPNVTTPATWAQAIPKSKSQSISIADEKVEDGQQEAYYIGCIAHKNLPLIMVTEPMTFWEAYDWAMSASRFSEYGKGKNWGLYTMKEDDAFMIAYTLGSFLPPIHEFAGIGSGMNNHYHVYGHDFQSYFKHFHVWYGGPQ